MNENTKNIWIVILIILLVCSIASNFVMREQVKSISTFYEASFNMSLETMLIIQNESITRWKNIATSCVDDLNESYIRLEKENKKMCEICLTEMKESYMLGATIGVDYYDDYADNLVCKFSNEDE